MLIQCYKSLGNWDGEFFFIYKADGNLILDSSTAYNNGCSKVAGKEKLNNLTNNYDMTTQLGEMII